MDIHIRNATAKDAEAVASLHASVWHATYQSLAPAEAIATLTAKVRLARWQVLLQSPAPDQVTLLACDGDTLSGFGQLAPTSNAQFGGRLEIRSLYIANPYQGRGIGRRLMSALAQAAVHRGARGVALGVVNGNDRAVEFYERLGGRRIGRYTDSGPVWRSDNLVYAWDDLETLTVRASSEH